MKIIIYKSYIIYLLVLIYFKSAIAYENPNQFKVEADKSIEYFEKQKIYVASGNAKASKGKFSVKADNITAYMGQTENSNMTHMEATGNVIIINQDTIARSNFARYNFKEKIIILKGNTQSIEAKTFKLQSKKIISFDDTQKIATSEGDVKLVLSGPISIFSKKINAKFDKINNNLISASAKGNVKIETKSETITCNSAKYNNKTNLISLEGNVIIKRNKSILTGEKGYMNLNTRKSKIESSKSKRVKGVFSPIKK
ncbi:LPS export ABC transporter periplasmic protein LptC [bacterium]|nr:LPS export ABC transporter periplasmic protein LptC [bacterium]